MSKKIKGTKYSISSKDINPQGAMPMQPVPEQMKTKDNTSSGTSKDKSGDGGSKK